MEEIQYLNNYMFGCINMIFTISLIFVFIYYICGGYEE